MDALIDLGFKVVRAGKVAAYRYPELNITGLIDLNEPNVIYSKGLRVGDIEHFRFQIEMLRSLQRMILDDGFIQCQALNICYIREDRRVYFLGEQGIALLHGGIRQNLSIDDDDTENILRAFIHR